MKKLQRFNMVIVGVGGQGLISLLRILAEAALAEGNEVRTSELHGLSQRGGSVEAHLRFGKEIYSPLVIQAGAELILGLEIQECLQAVNYASPQTRFLVNEQLIPIPLQEPVSKEAVLKELKRITKNITVVPASEICQKELGTNVTAGVYLLSTAVKQGLIPLGPESILRSIEKVLPEKHWEINKKTFELAQRT